MAEKILAYSIIIPTYNRSDQLADCLRALAPQIAGRSDVEVIIVNDGGSKEHLEKLQKLSVSPTVLCLETNLGPSAARNAGMRHAAGDIVYFLDDDSLPAADWFGSSLQAWREHPEADGVGGPVAVDPDETPPCRINALLFNWLMKQNQEDGGNVSFLSSCNASYRKKGLKKVEGFDESFKKPAGEDRDLNIKLMAAGCRLKFTESMKVYHGRGLSVRRFVKKHMMYGVASRRLFKKYETRSHFSLLSYGRLFQSVNLEFRSVFSRLSACCLLILSQIATLWGYMKTFLMRDDSV